MEKPAHTIRVRLLGKEVPVRTTLPEEQVRRVEQYVTERLERLSGVTGSADTLLMATLALMQLAEECIALREEIGFLNSGLDERLDRIVRMLEVDR